ncbi:MAG: sodium-dependent bicarbonate transport family permease [Burkholderiaceae bacterium]|nr:sodium-dependent bicarbonate transport family permease [Burkholderiaceae bacterium]
MQNFLDPAILFFVFGIAAGLLRSNLEIPPQIAKFLSLYLLMALGLKGGFALAASGLSPAIAASLLASVIMAFVVPVLGYAFLKNRVPKFDAAAVAASYGSVSAVTFVTAMQYAETQQVAVGGHMAVAMVLMESPAIIVAIVLANMLRREHAAGAQDVRLTPQGTVVATAGPGAPGTSIRDVLHESLTNGTHLLLLASLAIGFLSGEAGKEVMKPFSADLFKGMLAFFLLDMGLVVAKNLRDARGKAPVLLLYAIVSPFVHAAIALLLAIVLGLSVGDAGLLMVLSASASYIVVPAVLRYAVPEANPSVYLGLPIGVTFPINLLVGIPLYMAAAERFIG